MLAQGTETRLTGLITEASLGVDIMRRKFQSVVNFKMEFNISIEGS